MATEEGHFELRSLQIENERLQNLVKALEKQIEETGRACNLKSRGKHRKGMLSQQVQFYSEMRRKS
jgi:hypothetical protein